MDAPFVQGEENSLVRCTWRTIQDEKPDTGLMNDSLRRGSSKGTVYFDTARSRCHYTYTLVLNGEHSMTLEEIGEKFNLTRERVRQIKEKAIRRLRHTSRSKALKPYLG